MEVGDQVKTPRFLWVKINRIFENEADAWKEGFNQPTYYEDPEWEIVGKSIDIYHMIFAAVRK